MPYIYGYCRASDARVQILSPERQEAQITERAKLIERDEGATFAKIRTDRASATRIRWDKRLEFRKLMRELEKDDHLIIWRLDRLDRTNLGMLECLQWLVKRGVNIHVLEHGEMKIDMNTAVGELMVSFMAGLAQFEASRLSESVKAAFRYCKANGLSTGGPPGFGRKLVSLPGRKGERHHRKVVLWDEKECRQIREIYERSLTGRETIRQIALDFFRRGEKTATDKPWVHIGKRGQINCSRVYRVLHWYKELLAADKDLGCDVREAEDIDGQQPAE